MVNRTNLIQNSFIQLRFLNLFRQKLSPKDAKKRAQVLGDLKAKFISPQSSQKKISQYRLYRCEWKIGDIFAYQLESEEAAEKGVKGHYVYFVKVAERIWHPGHIIPRVYLFRQMGPELLDIGQLRSEFFAWPTQEGTGYPSMLDLINTSRRVIPSKLIYLGNRTDLQLVVDERKRYWISTYWKEFEHYIRALYS